MALLRKDTNNMQKKVRHYKKYNINVGTATQTELIELVAHISRTSKSELQKVLAEADRVGKGDVLRMKWKQDVDERIALITKTTVIESLPPYVTLSLDRIIT